MGRKRKDENEKKVPFNLSIKKKVIEEFKKVMGERGEVPSNIIEEMIKEYLEKFNIKK